MNASNALRHGLDWDRATQALATACQPFIGRNPRSAALARQAQQPLMLGVPLP